MEARSLTGRYSVETPERIELSLERARPGARFCAPLIGLLLSWLVSPLVFVIIAFVGIPSWDLNARSPTESPRFIAAYVRRIDALMA